MATTIDLVKDSTMQGIKDQLELQNAFLAVLAKKESEVNINSWQAVQSIVRAGLHDKVFSIGDQFICKKIKNFSMKSDFISSSSAWSIDVRVFMSRQTAIKEEYRFDYYDGSWYFEDKAVTLSDYGISLLKGTPIEGNYMSFVPYLSQLVFDIIGFDNDMPADKKYKHSMTLMCHTGEGRGPYNGSQALYYAENGLEAGTYYFEIPNVSNDVPSPAGNYNFTLTNAVPAGGQILINWLLGVDILDAKISTVSDCMSETYIESNVAVSVGEVGTFLGIADGRSENLNDYWSARYGKYDWETSDVRQWCNATVKSGGWKPQNVFARAPFWVDNTYGFLCDLDPEFVNVLGEVKKYSAKIEWTEDYDLSDNRIDKIAITGIKETADKVFILSEEELYSEDNNAVEEGKAYRYFEDALDKPTPYNTPCDAKIKYSTLGSTVLWWTRSPNNENSGYGFVVYKDGRIGSAVAANSKQWIVPAVSIV